MAAPPPVLRRTPLPLVALRLLAGLLASMGLAAFAFSELLLGFPVGALLYAVLAALFAFALLRGRPLVAQLGRVTILLVLWLAIAELFLVEWTSRKPFLRRLDRIELGMDEAQVRRIMDGYMLGTGIPTLRPGAGAIIDSSSGVEYPTNNVAGGEMVIQGALVFRHSNDGAFNCDWGIVRFHDGRVVDVSFSPD